MRVIITCGPSFEPVDQVRRLTNFSTGELGSMLRRSLMRAGHETICFRGVAATHTNNLDGIHVLPFTTNEDLARQLQEHSLTHETDVIFHTAALADFRLTRICDAQGNELHSRKLSSHQPKLTLELEPSFKVIRLLRSWFPRSRLVGWKYELEGTTQEALSRAHTQVIENQTNACVVNGQGYGKGFGFYEPNRTLQHLESKESLCEFLVKWIS